MSNGISMGDVPGWMRPMAAGPNDQPVGITEWGEPIYGTQIGVQYTLGQNPDGRSWPEKLKDTVAAIWNAPSPGFPTWQGTKDTARAIVEPVERAVQGTATLGEVLGMAVVPGAPGVAKNAGRYDPTTVSAMGGGDLWHPAGGVKLKKPVSEMTSEIAPTGSLQPKVSISPEALQGKTLIPAYGDRTAAGGVLSSVDDVPLTDDVLLQGGQGFMREQGTGIWASDKTPMATKADVAQQVAEAGGDPLMVYTSMGSQAGDFSHMMSGAIMGQIPHSKIAKKSAKAYDDIIRARVDADWPGILSPGADKYVDQMSGTNRRLLWQEMDKAAFRDAGFPDVAAARVAITDPQLLNADPMSGGTSIGRPETLGSLLDSPAVEHQTYTHQLGGDYVGGLDAPVPGEILWRDFFAKRRAAGVRPAGDQRAMMMQSRMTQEVDQQMIDEIMDYLGSQRSAR